MKRLLIVLALLVACTGCETPLAGKPVKKVIIVPGRMVNIVTG